MKLLLSEVIPRFVHRNNSSLPLHRIARNSAARLSSLSKIHHHHVIPESGQQQQHLGIDTLRQYSSLQRKRYIMPEFEEPGQQAQDAQQQPKTGGNDRKRARSDSNKNHQGGGGGGGRGGRNQQNNRNGGGNKKRMGKKAKKREKDMKGGTNEDVLKIDLETLRISLEENEAEQAEQAEAAALPEQGSEIEVEVVDISSTGEALAVQKGSKQIYVTNFAVPGDIIKVKVYRHYDDHSVADYISVVTPSSIRDDSRIQCKYFAQCGGCQYQMLDYPEQLRLKKRVVEKAFRNFSDLSPELMPAVQDTIGSPLIYGYRTKLTPHFDGPPGFRRGKEKQAFTSRPDIGFMLKQKRTTMDIEDCPIGTDAVRLGMKRERQRMETEYGKYSKGATLLLRESTQRIPKVEGQEPMPVDIDENTIKEETATYTDLKTCVTDNNAVSTEYVGDYVFHNPAGSFFQNNNSVLPVFTDYVRELITAPTSAADGSSETKPIKHLVDAYSGSGLFTITLSRISSGDSSAGAATSTGIDISAASIDFARKNAAANDIPPSRARFLAADARHLFDEVALGGKGTGGGNKSDDGQEEKYDPDATVVILDPPRKGCDESFLDQLMRFAPRRVVYVSCNVHTQARDIGVLVRGLEKEVEVKGAEGAEGGEEKKEKKMVRYSVDSLRGFDFFPQTYHVEGVAVLNRVD